MMLVRRQFIGSSTLVVLSPLAVACGSDDGDDGGEGGACDGAGATTSSSFGHTHFVCVDDGDLMDPPATATFETTVNDGHSHRIMLSAEQLADIAGGGTVMVTTSNDDGHTHDVSLERNG